MKLIDQSYRFHLPGFLSASWFLDCHLQIFESLEQTHTVVTKNIVLVTNMGFEMGWFIPNLIESLVNQVVHEFNLDPSRLVWVEYYPVGESKYYQAINETGLSMVNFNWKGGKATEPQWVSITIQTLQGLLGQDMQAILGRDAQVLMELGRTAAICGRTQPASKDEVKAEGKELVFQEKFQDYFQEQFYLRPA